jgi:FG-GAP-like repeat
MKAQLTRHLLAALLSVAFTAEIHAQPSAFTYQGQLTDNGSPANGIYDLRFTIYDLDTGGSVIAGPITNSPSAVSNGLFTVTLDFGAGVFDGSDRWLEIGVATNGGGGSFSTLTPRQEITSTPYAIQAANAANAAVAASANSVAAANITGTVGLAQLPTTLVTNGASGVNLSGTFSGDGAGVTNVNLLNVNTHGAISFGANFVLASSPGVGNQPYSVTTADVNSDGYLDLICTLASTSTLTVLTNDGSGSFVLASSPGVGSASPSVTAADVNGDGHPDLISANISASTLTVLTNDGSGGFVVSSSPPVGIHPFSVTSADVNGDNKPDLICANIDDNTLTVLTNDGSGGFVMSSSPGVGNYPQSVTAADVNGDGFPDLISADDGDNTLTVLTNDGSGGFVIASSPPVSSPFSVTAADVNGDGHPDLISENYDANTLTVLTNDGSGGFVLASSPGVGKHPQSVTAADVNGDGHPDLISANYIASGTLTVLTNDGSGGFVMSSSPPVGKYPQSVTAADVNGDGFPDLISADDGDNTLTVLFNVVASYNGVFTGDGSRLTGLNATHLTGSVPAASLTSVPAASLTGTVGLAHLPSAVVTNNETGVTLGGTFSGDGGGLTNLNAGNISSGTVGLAQLPTAVLVTNGASGVTISGSFTGDGGGLSNLNATHLTGSVPAASLTSVPAASLTGTVPLAQLPAAVVTNNETGVTLGGTFSGNGGGLTNLNAGNISSGTVGLAQLPTAVLVTNGASGVNISGTFSGDGSGLTGTGDNLGNHTATENIVLNGHWLSGDGSSNGVFVTASGNVGIGANAPSEALEVLGNAQISAANPQLILFGESNGQTKKSAISTIFDTELQIPPPGPADQHLSFYVSDATSSGMTRVMDLLGNGNVGIGTTTPQETLDVKGEIRFTSSQDRYPVATDLKTVMVAGIVNAAGNKTGASSSALFTSTNQSTGTYVITLNAGFTADPIITVTAHVANYAALGSVNKTNAVIYIRDSAGTLVNGNFNFIAIGAR